MTEVDLDFTKIMILVFFCKVVLRWVFFFTLKENGQIYYDPSEEMARTANYRAPELIRFSYENEFPVYNNANANANLNLPHNFHINPSQGSLLQSEIMKDEELNTQFSFEQDQYFLPVGPNYFIKNPTEKQKQEFIKKEFTKDELVCKVCYTKESNTIINACGHGGMCSDCAKNVVKNFKKCMMCRTVIDQVLVVEISKETPGQVKVTEVIKIETK